MGQLTYKASKVNPNWLKGNNFFYSRSFSDADDPVYIRRFPVFRWGEISTLEGEMRLYINSLIVTIDVYDGGNTLTRGVYAPFYYEPDSGHRTFVEEITKNIEMECEKLGFVEFKD